MKENLRKILDINLILIIMWMGIVFYFSNQPSDISGNTSENISRYILEGSHIIDLIPQEEHENYIYNFESVLRKIAHYTIYLVGGILLFLYFRKFNLTNKKIAIITFIFGMLYSVTDEIHQSFIPGRSCMWQDVFLDSLGVITGIVVIITILKIINIHKGRIKMNKKIYLSSPHMSDEGYEQFYIKEAFDKNWIAPLGENVDKFEEEISRYCNINNAAALSSGTAAIHMALKALDVKENDIVFCQSFTFSATCNPIIYQNATPVFIDSEKETWNMDPKSLEKAFEKYPNPKAVIIVHLYGVPAKLDEIMQICKKHNVPVIEDAAESLGSKYENKYTGTFGDYGIFSFNGNKIITTSGGGMLISNNQEKIEKVRFWATQSREKQRYYEHKEIGYNYRMSNVLAGIGRGQLKVLEKRIQQKTDIYNLYKKEFENISDIKMQPNEANTRPNNWLSVITLDKNSKIKPIDIVLELEKENIESRLVWKPMHLQPIFKNYDFITIEENGSVCEDIFERSLCLPSDTNMIDEEIMKIIKIIKSSFK